MSQPAGAPARWRAFGRRADVDVAFEGSARPRVVTDLLARCREGAGPDEDVQAEMWNLSLSRRALALLRVLALTETERALTGDAPALDVTLRCPRPECGEPLVLSLAHEALNDYAGDAVDGERLRFEHPQIGTVALRRPTGRDQLAWLDRVYASEAEATAAIVGSLVVEGRMPDEVDSEWLAALAGAMEAFDPLVCFGVEITCPACGTAARLGVDLEAVALERLERAQRRLLTDVHELACAYGWTEARTLAIPAWRRAHYLRLVREARGAA